MFTRRPTWLSKTHDPRRAAMAFVVSTAAALLAVALTSLFNITLANELVPQVGENSRADRPSDVPDPADKPESSEKSDAADRVREGTRWQNERGVFTLVGDRVTFSKGGQNYVVLENLNLERIVRTIEENRTVTDADTLEWNVDASVTEFRGANFVLITRSVLVARPRGTSAAP